MSNEHTFLRQLGNIIKNRKSYYQEYKAFLMPFLNLNLDSQLKNRITELLSLNHVSTAELDNIIEQLISDIYKNQKPILAHKLKEPLTNYCNSSNKTIEYLKNFGIITVEDILYHFPYKYDELSLNGSDKSLLTGICEEYKIVNTKTGKRVLEVLFRNNSTYFYGIWFHFNNRYPLGIIKKGVKYNLFGKVQIFNGLNSIVHPELIDDKEVGAIRPVYILPEKVKDNFFRSILVKVFISVSDYIVETLPINILTKYSFFDIKNSFKYIHFPENRSDLKQIHISKERFIYEELFYLQLGLLVRKRAYGTTLGLKFEINKEMLESIKDFIPFKLTHAQKKALKDIFNDMRSEYQMNRLIQGDVGSGKTIVAFISGIMAVKNSYQVAIIAPTEILAEQHFKNFINLFGAHFKACLLVGSLKDKEKKTLKDLIEMGEFDFIFGTHALIQEDVTFKRLGFVIIDEQHRFGVMQRKSLIEKGLYPDILLMSATPIPRTLSLTLYGDLNISVIDELPPGRKKVVTKAYGQKNRFQVFEFVKSQIEKGLGAYFVYPLIDESDSLELKAATKSYEEIAEYFGSEHVGLLHGKMKSNEKQYLMDKFKNNEIKVLVSTTVIEVGVDVSHATVMVIENAERFGLSQLHQLRGRVGRGADESYCFLIYSDKISEDGMKRIKAMVNYHDGFKLSEIDLEMRGPGDLFGTRQSGIPELRVSNLIRDAGILFRAREDASEILTNDPLLEHPEHKIIKENLKYKWKDSYDLISVG